MLRLLESDLAGERLRDLLAHFRTQELSLTAALHAVQAEVERAHRDVGNALLAPPGVRRAAAARCTELQLEADLLATQLVHARMAIAGTTEELLAHDERRFVAAGALLTPA